MYSSRSISCLLIALAVALFFVSGDLIAQAPSPEPVQNTAIGKTGENSSPVHYDGRGLTVQSVLSGNLQRSRPAAKLRSAASGEEVSAAQQRSLFKALIVGLALRPALNSFTGEGTENFDPRLGMDLSTSLMMPLLIQMEFLREIYLLAALSYISRGAAYSTTGDFSFEERIRLSYIALSISFRGAVAVAENFPLLSSIYFGIGPTLGLLVGDQIKYTSNGRTDTGELGAKTANFGLALALGAMLPLGPGFLDLALRYEHGFTGIIDTGGSDAPKTAAWMFSLGYVLTLSQLLNR